MVSWAAPRLVAAYFGRSLIEGPAFQIDDRPPDILGHADGFASGVIYRYHRGNGLSGELPLARLKRQCSMRKLELPMAVTRVPTNTASGISQRPAVVARQAGDDGSIPCGGS